MKRTPASACSRARKSATGGPAEALEPAMAVYCRFRLAYAAQTHIRWER
jgi:hypothetical protein